MASEELVRVVRAEVEQQIKDHEVREFMGRIVDNIIELEQRIQQLEKE